jgi:hypothetical protein
LCARPAVDPVLHRPRRSPQQAFHALRPVFRLLFTGRHEEELEPGVATAN